MQQYAISKLQPIFAESVRWIPGEYGAESAETEELLARILVLLQTTVETK
jgi:hypothetical protein